MSACDSGYLRNSLNEEEGVAVEIPYLIDRQFGSLIKTGKSPRSLSCQFARLLAGELGDE